MRKEREVGRKATVGMKKEPGADKGRGETKKREKEGGREKKAGEERAGSLQFLLGSTLKPLYTRKVSLSGAKNPACTCHVMPSILLRKN